MTIWYTLTMALLYISVAIFVLASYNPAVRKGTTQFLQNEAKELAHDLELKHDVLYWDDSPSTEPGVYYSIFKDTNTLAFSNHEMDWLNDLSFNAAEVVHIQNDGKSWIVVDRLAYDDDQPIAQVRVAYSESSAAQSSGTQYMFSLFLIGFPIIAALSLLVGWFIAKYSLKPIDKITKTADEIASSGELSKRVTIVLSHDEVGRLAKTFNNMLNALQDAFAREQQFTNDASHELRTPLSVIIAYAEDALNSKNPSLNEYKNSMQTIYAKGKDMQAMISQMLLLARMFEGTRAIEKHPLQLDEVLQDVVEELTEKAEEKNISISILSVPVQFDADLLLITRLFLNLIENAIRYSDYDTQIKITGSKENNFVVIKISDQGYGISAQDQPHIFERFYQADASHSSNGTGLGLAICKQIVLLHNGTITLESEVGKGSCFTICLPCS